jgi:hypothetical protein
MGVLAIALFLQGSRGTLLTTLLAVATLAALKRRSPTVVLAAIAAIFAAVFFASAGADLTINSTEGDTKVAALIQHQVSGITNPSESTLGLHIEIYLRGLEQGLSSPIGEGPTKNRFKGTVSVKGQNQELSPEGEFPITLIALGVPAGIALLGIYLTAFRYAFRLYRLAPTARHAAWVGFLVAGGDQMLNGRLYFTSAVVAIGLGGMAVEWANRGAGGATPAAAIRPVPVVTHG